MSVNPSNQSQNSKSSSFGSTKKRSRSVTDEELRLAFEALTGGAEVLTVETFAQKTKDFRIHNFRELIGESGQLTFDDLKELLMNNERLLTDDPVEQSMKFLDPMNTGFVDLKLLKTSIERTFKTEISQQEMENIIKAVDSDGDGKISLNDWDQLLSFLFVYLYAYVPYFI